MSKPRGERSEPGDRPPPASTARLDRPPSDRYRPAAAGPGAGTNPQPGRPLPRASATGPIAAAVIVAVLGAAALTVMLGVLLVTTGTFVVSLLAGAAIGLLVSGATVARAGSGTGSAARSAAAPLSRGTGNRVAIGLALGMVILAGLATWVLARAEGGVMDPVGYLWTTFGLGIPAQAVVAVLAAAWGAARGPIRWRE